MHAAGRLIGAESQEATGVPNQFGYGSIAGIVTLPRGGTAKYGGWSVHLGQEPGETTKVYNGGDGSQFIGSVGFGFTY